MDGDTLALRWALVAVVAALNIRNATLMDAAPLAAIAWILLAWAAAGVIWNTSRRAR
ncbi:hypothetical protein P5G50_18415 [Leifsonia sp. F6_8S_P_1B]|uniref:Uncharacterized protein n=1 Tax=Leifsonia williamsii TaxID=3035919 RepID=A0ABT8KI23_9MICO|nr:hypothetical protein [Leifsonia williamsii]MDN4616426.1 hypothetical protein [Leifsonia williamsii]